MFRLLGSAVEPLSLMPLLNSSSSSSPPPSYNDGCSSSSIGVSSFCLPEPFVVENTSVGGDSLIACTALPSSVFTALSILRRGNSPSNGSSR